MENLLIIDDNQEILTQLKWGFSKDFSVHLAPDRLQGMAVFTRVKPRVVILDLGLPPAEETSEEGFRCLDEILALNPDAKVIVMTGNSEQENALRAIRMGAYDFYPKPPVLAELKVIVSRAFHLANIENQNRLLKQSLQKGVSCLPGMVGESPEMIRIAEMIKKVATTDAPVLITGESGTGKELVARAIHQLGHRCKGPFVAINCGAIPEQLMESELFGHVKGSFTGAHASTTGKIQTAEGGTLFLDELGELPPPLQVKLLRFLQDGVIQKVGSTESIRVTTHLLCATNVDPLAAIQEGKLREDLYYRVGVVSIHLPPLRERGKDRILLAHYFLNEFNEQYGKKVRRFTPDALRMIDSHPWPGNVRELRNRIQRAVIMSDSQVIEPSDLNLGTPSAELHDDHSSIMTLRAARERLEKEMIASSLDRNDGNIVRTADELGVSRPTLYDLMKKYGLGIRQ